MPLFDGIGPLYVVSCVFDNDIRVPGKLISFKREL